MIASSTYTMKNDAKAKVRELLSKLEISEAPVPIEEIANYLGAKVHYKPLKDDLSGMVLIEEDGKAVIGINSLHPETRQRFTLAHEVAHLILHCKETLHLDGAMRTFISYRNVYSSLGLSRKEIEANRFAAELLMPESFLKVDLAVDKDRLDPEDLIEKLSLKYQVSVQCMTLRLNHLHLIV